MGEAQATIDGSQLKPATHWPTLQVAWASG
jgi:hypothetical protein